MIIIDSHCHLDLIEKTHNLDEVLNGAARKQVSHILGISTSLDNIARVHDIATIYPNVYCTVGVHPLNASFNSCKQMVEVFTPYLDSPKVVGLGEVGLDFYKNQNTKEVQYQNFEQHVELAIKYDLPLVIHTRGSDQETIDFIKDQYQRYPIRGVVHCFTASLKLAKEMLDIGFYISASGIATFKNAGEIREALALVPNDRLLIETDAPYLAPDPLRGKPNLPEYLHHTATYLAKMRGVTLEELAHYTTDNFFTLFNRAASYATLNQKERKDER